MTKRIDWAAQIAERWADPSDPEDQPFIHAFVHLYSIFGAPIGEGCERTVFASRNRATVIKMPRNFSGDAANGRELCPDNWLGDKNRYARAWEDKQLTEQTGLLIIRMEWVRPVIRGKLPKWADAVDCAQVGYNAAGRLVAYDFG
jgi:hypothetical protein